MLKAFEIRLHGYVEKALREAKRHSSWVNVDEDYEGRTKGLVSAILQPGSAFLDAFRPFARRLAEAGIANGLVRTVLKSTLPGVPDVYQGTEFWDFSLVDPDNRRRVDYVQRAAALSVDAPASSFGADPADGRVKQAVLATLLADRASVPLLYAAGDYRPLRATGSDAERIVAYGRRQGAEELVTAALRFPTGGQGAEDTTIAVPRGEWRDILSGRILASGAAGLAARELFESLPVAVLRRTV